MTASAQWTGYSPEEMRRQYVVREVVPDAMSYLERWRQQSAPVRADYADHLDIAYGPHPAETLDVLRSRTLAAKAPVQILIHGGYWRALHKDEFAFVAIPALEVGVLNVVVNYELCPLIAFDGLVDQCRRAFRWTVENIAAFGGNPDNIYLAGHSAGAHLAAMMLATDWRSELRGRFTVRGVCAISGLYDLAPLPHTPLQSDLRLTTEQIDLCSPILLPPHVTSPMLLSWGTLETPEFIRQTGEYGAHCEASGLNVALRPLESRHHYSALDALAEPDHPLCREWVSTMTTG
jgi:arylformamidase